VNTRSGVVLSFAAKQALRGRGNTCSGTTASSSAGVSRSTAQRMPSNEPWKYWGLAILGLLAASWAVLGATVWWLMQAASAVAYLIG
jgi:hypothetical protein